MLVLAFGPAEMLWPEAERHTLICDWESRW